MKFGLKYLSCAALLMAGACAGTGGKAPVQPPLAELGPDQFGHYAFRSGGDGYFRDQATRRLVPVGIVVDVSTVDKAPPATRKIYYTVRMDVWGDASPGRNGRLSRRGLEAVPDDLLADAHLAISQKVQSRRLIELAAMVSKFSICVDGVPRTDDRNIARTSVSPQQSARISTTFGGNPAGILGKPEAQLQRLGLGDVASGGKKIPAIDFDRHHPGYVNVRMMCVLG